MWSDRVYVAYGDYGANTGPIHALSIDPGTGTVNDEATLTTDATWIFRTTSLGLTAPFVDPQGSFDPSTGQYAHALTPDSWTIATDVAPVPEHVFDVVETVEGLWLFGSAGMNAIIWRSADGGATWTASLTVAGTGLARFYSGMAFTDGTILTIFEDTAATSLYQWSAGTWTNLAGSPATVGDAVRFARNGVEFFYCIDTSKQDGLAADSAWHVVTKPGVDPSPITAALPSGFVLDATVTPDGQKLLILAGNGTVYRIGQTGALETLGQLDVPATALAADNVGNLYLGTTAGTIRTATV